MYQQGSVKSRWAVLALVLVCLFLVPASADDCEIVSSLFNIDTNTTKCCGLINDSTSILCDNLNNVISVMYNARNMSLSPEHSEPPLNCSINSNLAKLTNLQSLTLINFVVVASACPLWPDWIGQLTNLQYLNLQNNLLEESFFNMSTTWNNLTHLEKLILTDNSFQTVPDFLGNIPSLTAVDLSENPINSSNITGLNLPNLQQLNISLIYSTPPTFLSTFTALKSLYIYFQVAYVPCDNATSFFELCSSLDASFLEPIAKMTWLQTLSIDQMDLMDPTPIPTWLTNFTALNSLTLSGCRLDGTIPDFLGHLNLSYIDLSYNLLNGSIPGSIYNPNLQSLYLTDNNLVGELPKSLYNIPNCYLGVNLDIICPTLASSPALCIRCGVELSFISNSFSQIADILIVDGLILGLIFLGYLFVLVARRRSLPLSFFYVFLTCFHLINLVVCIFVFVIRLQLANALLIALAFGCSIAWNLNAIRAHIRSPSVLPSRGIPFQIVRALCVQDLNNLYLFSYPSLFPNSNFAITTRRMVAYTVPQILLTSLLPLVIVSIQLNIWLEGFFLLTAIVSAIAIVRFIAQIITVILWGKGQEARMQRRADGIKLEDRERESS